MTRILLGVTGGIACYKSPDLVRRLIDRGATVQVVMTAGAQQFVTPLTFQAVSGRAVRTDLWDEEAELGMGHIELARWADKILIAPASADFIGRYAAGLGNDLLTTVCLASEAPVLLAPAMNRQMWQSPAVQDNLTALRERGVTMLGPGVGDQACGETGAGRMLEPAEIAEATVALKQGPLVGQHVVITAGPTREAIDPVRYLTNRSSGKMGYAMAEAALAAGAAVTLITGPVSLTPPVEADVIRVESAAEMLAAATSVVSPGDLFIAAAAVSDYRPEHLAQQKIKKSDATMSLTLTRNPDILATVAGEAEPPFTVGFAAETENVREYALGKMEKKKLNMIIANQVGEKLAFDQDDNAVTVYWPGGEQAFERQDKQGLAKQLMDCIAARFVEVRG
ncbi:MAG: bifunctional phosphopantothenoylcysteine decarboxylase/phosphopantothenate--cysteine ligase CoaBC [Pseudomonadota bacterium]